jgi:hypothetical protein
MTSEGWRRAGRIEVSACTGNVFARIDCRKIRMRRRLPRTYAAGEPDDAYAHERRVMLDSTSAAVLAAVFNLNHPAHTVDWHFIHLSVSNVVVIGLMLIVFVLAILLPFPGAGRRRRGAS